MPASFYQIRQCENPVCGLRYPLTEGHPFGERCPLCLGPTRMEIQKGLEQEPFAAPALPSKFSEGRWLEALLDNVRSAWNVGAIFRTSDAFGLHRLHLCGFTPTPENVSVAKTALGADKTIPWTSSKNALITAQELKSAGAYLCAVEQDPRAVPIETLADLPATRLPLVVIVGNEISGVDPALLDLCDKICFIPMRGQKRSLNVEVAFGVAVSRLVF